MNMACVQSTAVNLFDEYCLLIPPKLKSRQDGPPGQRVIFITEQKEIYTDYTWSDGIEPVLMELLSGIAVCKTKGGGCD